MILLEWLYSLEAEKLGGDTNEGEFCVIGSTSVKDELKSLSAIRKESLVRLNLFIIKINCFNDFFVNAVTICTLILASTSVNGCTYISYDLMHLILM